MCLGNRCSAAKGAGAIGTGRPRTDSECRHLPPPPPARTSSEGGHEGGVQVPPLLALRGGGGKADALDLKEAPNRRPRPKRRQTALKWWCECLGTSTTQRSPAMSDLPLRLGDTMRAKIAPHPPHASLATPCRSCRRARCSRWPS